MCGVLGVTIQELVSYGDTIQCVVFQGNYAFNDWCSMWTLLNDWCPRGTVLNVCCPRGTPCNVW